MQEALGLVETVGISTAIEVADVMVKAANVKLLELENSRGSGFMTVKVVGDVGAVKAAVDAAKAAGVKYGNFVSASVIARPADGMAAVFCNPKVPYQRANGYNKVANTKVEAPKTEAPKAEVKAEPKVEVKPIITPEVKKEEPKKEEPKKEEPKKEEPKKEEPKKAEPKKVEPKAEAPKKETASTKPKEVKKEPKTEPQDKKTTTKTSKKKGTK